MSISDVDVRSAGLEAADHAESAHTWVMDGGVDLDGQPSGVDAAPSSVSPRTAATFQVRIHGREGRGATTAARLLAAAVQREGRWSEAPRWFGRERSGAPVEALCRIGDAPIRGGHPDAEIDALIILDAIFVHQAHVLRGLKPDGYLLVNSSPNQHLGLHDLARTLPHGHVLAVPANDLATRHVGRQVPNTALLGAFAAMTGLVTLESINAAIRERFSGTVADGNVAAASQAYHDVMREPLPPTPPSHMTFS
jgi:pyruvate ferredoxin oxidoreductase gamma subunit